MRQTAEKTETLHFTLELSPSIAAYMRRQVSTGIYKSEVDYLESLLVSDALFEPLRDDKLDRWVRTEGVRRCAELDADPSKALTEEQAFAFLNSEEDFDELDA